MKAVKNVLTSYITFCYVYVKFKRTNQSCPSSKINQSNNAECHTCGQNGKQFFQWKLENFWLVDKARNVLIEKWTYEQRNIYSTEAQKNTKVVNVYIRFHEEGSLF